MKTLRVLFLAFLALPAFAQNVPVNQLPSVGTVLASDLIIDDQTPSGTCAPSTCTRVATLQQISTFTLGPGQNWLGNTIPVNVGGTGAQFLSGLLKGNGTSALTSAVSADVYALWSGVCSSTTFLRGDGSCQTPAGSGNVSTSGAPANGNLTQWSSGTTITNADLSGDCTTSGTLAIVCTATNGTSFGTFATKNYATPPAIGGTTPAAGTFTTLAATTITATNPLGAAYGGTGVVNSNTFTLTGGHNATFLAPPSGNVGSLELVQNAQNGNYTTILSDNGKHLYFAGSSATTYTIDSNAHVAYPLGATITFINDGSAVLSIAITSDTMLLSPSQTTGTRSCQVGCIATAIKVGTTRWYISGTGIT